MMIGRVSFSLRPLGRQLTARKIARVTRLELARNRHSIAKRDVGSCGKGSGGRMKMRITSDESSSSTMKVVPMDYKNDGVESSNEQLSDAHGAGTIDYTRKKKPAVMFVLGGPGAGKGTQCAKLSEKYGMVHLSAGDLLRAARDSGSENGKLIDKLLKEGSIVPVQITLDLLKEEIMSTSCSRFLIDGFPRNYDNLNGWLESSMDSICDVEGCIFFDCPESELEKRLLDRGKTSGRSDDNLESARKRFKTYQESTMPIIDYYKEKNMLLAVSGDQSMESVFTDLDKLMRPYIADEVIHLTQQHIHCLGTGNWDLYKSTFCPEVTSFETQQDMDSGSTDKATVRGVDAHRRYFDRFASKKSDILGKPLVRVLGKVAIISYVRQMHNDETGSKERYHETKIWSLNGKSEWKAVHLHLECNSAI